MATTAVPEHVLSPDPSEQDGLVELREQLARIAARRKRPVARLVGPDGSEVEIPASAFAALQAVARDMAQGVGRRNPDSRTSRAVRTIRRCCSSCAHGRAEPPSSLRWGLVGCRARAGKRRAASPAGGAPADGETAAAPAA